MFLSADVDYPKQLEQAGLSEPGSFFVYALGRLVVWTRNPSALEPGESWSQVLRDSSGRVAIANPRHAPYGRAATAAMEKSGVWEQVSDRIVLGENVAQAAQFVASGAAELGILPLSLALSSADAGDRQVLGIAARHIPADSARRSCSQACPRGRAPSRCRSVCRMDSS